MSIFDTNITEEEKLSGYSASEQGDETFKLETLGDYPGVFPDFVDEEEPLVPLESAFEDNEEDFEEDFEDSYDDEFDEDYDDQNLDDGFTDNEVENEFSIPSGEGVFEDSDLDISDYEEETNSIFSDDSEIEELSEEELRSLNGEDNNSSSEYKEYNNSLSLDDDFKNILENDLSKSKQNSDIPSLDNFTNDDTFSSNESFPIDDEILADVINFDDIKADKPSNYGIDSIEAEDNTDPKNIDDIKKNKKEKKEKSKKLFYIYGSVAALLLISLITVTFLNKDRIFNSIVSNGDSTLVDNKLDSSKSTHSKSENKVKNKPDNNNKDITLNVDSLDKNNEIIDSNLIEKNEVDLSNEQENENNLAAIENKELKNKNISNVDVNETKNDNSDIVKNERVTEKTKESPKIKTTTKNKTNTTNIRSNDGTESKKINSNLIQKDNKEKISNIPYPKKDLSDEGIFTVQIYATQSKEDAVYWLNKLKDQKINDGFISEQVIRDEIWYRVRFGNFTNKDKALEEASKLGYAQTWVDRVK